MNGMITWFIIAVFYAPLHFAGPVGVVIVTTAASPFRTRLIRYIVLECAASMVIAFMLVIWLVQERLGLAMLILLLSMFVPYLTLYLHKVFHTSFQTEDSDK